jgi:quercetin dioxygenase-like cupin family protein
MRVVHSSEVEGQSVAEAGASGAAVRWLLAGPEGAPTFAMRLFELARGGFTPLHEHAWEHEVFVLEGRAELFDGTRATAVGPGDAVLVLPGERHQFRNAGEGPARFLCMIPLAKSS